MSPVKKSARRDKRRYYSPGRRQQAEATRQRLIASARRLFAAKGYAATSIDAIAREAGVAAPTFYAVFGSKAALLLALLNAMENEAEMPRLGADLRATREPRKQIRACVDFGVRLYGRSADVLEIIRTAGMAEKDLGALWAEGEKRRRMAQKNLVRDWRKGGLLKAGMSSTQACDIFWALTGPDSYRLLVAECGWRIEAYASWLEGTISGQLLR